MKRNHSNFFEILFQSKNTYIALFPVFIFCSFSLLDTMATASTRIDINKFTDTSNDHSNLRGEIWYGNASWYGSRFHGKKTSNGEKFDRKELTAAHKFLPFNTKVLVTNLKNKKSVIVRINDRGPFVGNRIIDLSEEAADKIDVRKEGVAYIKLQVMTPLIDNNGSSGENISEN